MKKIGFVLAVLLQSFGSGSEASALSVRATGWIPPKSILAVDQGSQAPFGHALEPFVTAEATQDIAPETGTDGDEKSEAEKFLEAVEDAEKQEGLLTLYRNSETGDLHGAIQPEQLNKSFLLTMTLEGGIGEGFLYSGLPLQDFLVYFRRVNNKLQFVARNVNFRAQPGDPVQKSLDRSFSDSVLYTFDIKATDPEQGGILVDFGGFLLKEDLADLKSLLQAGVGAVYSVDADASYLSSVKAFPQNLEIQANYGVSRNGEGGRFLPTLADDRAFNLQVHYSLSQLPQNNGYRPRLADDRVGYFITVYQNLSNRNPVDPFTRYINRWHLEKQAPLAPLSPPKEPIVFWIENTVPLEYRAAIREGALMWNEAFAKAGFQDAIEVRQMPDDADWDPADVRYNTIRWLSALNGTFALGPSRKNPLTGEILDADILIGANYVRFIRQRATLFTGTTPETAFGFDNPTLRSKQGFSGSWMDNFGLCYPNLFAQLNPRAVTTAKPFQQSHHICRQGGLQQNFAMGALTLALNPDLRGDPTATDRFIHEFLRELTAHEVGHTLGLRHNFRGSTLLQPEELNDLELTQSRGLVSSVMDYNPVNLAPWGTPQGNYFTPKVGPYDEWAIEYGYRLTESLAVGAEQQMLQEIAQRSPEPALNYGTDEDSFANDPFTIRFDLSADSLQYSRWQLGNAEQLWQQLERRYPTSGGSYSELTEQFDLVFFHYFSNALVPIDYIGGQTLNRNHAGDPNARPPLQPVSLDKQQEALEMLVTNVFHPEAFDFSPELVNKLAPSRWSHWGNNVPIVRLDYPLYDRIFFLQRIVLQLLLSNYRLSLIQDLEFRTPSDQALTLPTLFKTLEDSIWTEVLEPSGNISSLRRALQREHMNVLIQMVLRQSRVPEDARTLAWYQLQELQPALKKALRRQRKNLDVYTRAHLEESYDRISKALDAPLQSSP